MHAAIEAMGVCKSFLIPHEQASRLKERVVHPFRRTTYERNEPLVDVTFEVQPGEFFGIIGANGSGKSTLLKILAGIYRADAGEVRVNGRLSPFIELGVGFSGELTARENIEINGMLLGLTRRQLAERFGAIIDFAGLGRFVDQQLKNYSSGMLTRLAFSVAIQVPFDILLVDEALAVGDADFQQKCLDTFDDLRERGKTVVLVSHDLSLVASFCDRALWLEDGIVQTVGDPADVIQAYRPEVLVTV